MNEKDKAKRLLEHKKMGFSYKLAYAGMKNRYILYLSSILILFYCTTKTNDNAILYILIGLFIGTFLRDYSWLKAMKISWPFTEKITNWKKVEEIANDEAEK
jgi:hypothetical protein